MLAAPAWRREKYKTVKVKNKTVKVKNKTATFKHKTERARARESEATKHKQWLRERGGA